jgi:hypothetical protein
MQKLPFSTIFKEIISFQAKNAGRFSDPEQPENWNQAVIQMFNKSLFRQ